MYIYLHIYYDMFGFWHLKWAHTTCGNPKGCAPSWKTSVVQSLGCNGFSLVGKGLIWSNRWHSISNPFIVILGSPQCIWRLIWRMESSGIRLRGIAELEIYWYSSHFLSGYSNLLLFLDFLITSGWWPFWQCLIAHIWESLEQHLDTFRLLVQIFWMRFVRKSSTRFIWAMIRRKLCRC